MTRVETGRSPDILMGSNVVRDEFVKLVQQFAYFECNETIVRLMVTQFDASDAQTQLHELERLRDIVTNLQISHETAATSAVDGLRSLGGDATSSAAHGDHYVIDLTEPEYEHETTNLAHITVGDPIADYFAVIGKRPLLTPAQEVDHFKAVEAGLFAAERLTQKSKAHSYHVGDLEEIARLGNESHQVLIESNLRLVVSIAKEYTGLGLDLLELIQEGTLGLMEAVQRFDYKKGNKFSTYARVWIHKYLKLAIGNLSRTIRTPMHIHQDIAAIRRAAERLALAEITQPSPEDFANATGLRLDRVKQIMNVMSTQALTILDAPLRNEPDSETIGTMLVSDSDEYARIDRETVVLSLIYDRDTKLTPNEIHAILLLYGFDGGGTRTMREIAGIRGVSQATISNQLASAHAKLRSAAERIDVQYPF